MTLLYASLKTSKNSTSPTKSISIKHPYVDSYALTTQNVPFHCVLIKAIHSSTNSRGIRQPHLHRQYVLSARRARRKRLRTYPSPSMDCVANQPNIRFSIPYCEKRFVCRCLEPWIPRQTAEYTKLNYQWACTRGTYVAQYSEHCRWPITWHWQVSIDSPAGIPWRRLIFWARQDKQPSIEPKHHKRNHPSIRNSRRSLKSR